ncbi:MarR family transcriptional regulator [Candidatus Woesearchaeota archaeon]|nr:MarR family transcriptional regulator [Candidatus Woesearchaeota archaeon]
MEISEKKLVIAIGAVFLLGVFFSIANGYYTQKTGDPLPLIAYAIAFISLAVGSALVLLFQSRINKMQLENILKILPQEERKIMEILVERKEIEQKHLVVLSGLSKVKVSRVLAKLEQRGIVEKKASGYTNLVIVKL